MGRIPRAPRPRRAPSGTTFGRGIVVLDPPPLAALPTCPATSEALDDGRPERDSGPRGWARPERYAEGEDRRALEGSSINNGGGANGRGCHSVGGRRNRPYQSSNLRRAGDLRAGA